MGRFSLIMLLLAAATAGVMAIGLMAGAKLLDPAAVFHALFYSDGFYSDGKIDSILVLRLRLPRSLAAFLAGAGMSISGYLLQVLTRNPLAGPGLTGVTGGAVAFIVYCVVFLPGLSSIYYPLMGMAGGLIAAAITLWISAGGATGPAHMALAGISVSLFCSAVTTYMILRGGPQTPSLLFWLAGGFQGRSWPQLAYLLPWVICGLAGTLASHRAISLFSLPEKAAAAMGLNTAIWKPVFLLLAVLPVAGIAPVAGPITFIGLVAPHIVRLLKPGGIVATIWITAMLGGFLVTFADLIARTMALPRELPISIVCAIIAGPVLVLLIQRKTLPQVQ